MSQDHDPALPSQPKSPEPQSDSLVSKLDRVKPEEVLGGVILRAALAAVFWYGFDDALAASLSNHAEAGVWGFGSVVSLTLMLTTIASAGGLVGRRTS